MGSRRRIPALVLVQPAPGGNRHPTHRLEPRRWIEGQVDPYFHPARSGVSTGGARTAQPSAHLPA